MKNNGSATMVVALTRRQTLYIFATMYLMGAKLCYFHRISLFRGGGILLTVKSDVVCQILWVSTSWFGVRDITATSRYS
jgi:hypothetical protein